MQQNVNRKEHMLYIMSKLCNLIGIIKIHTSRGMTLISKA